MKTNLLTDNKGNFSSIRVIALMVTGAIIFNFIWQTIETGNAQIDIEVIIMLLGTLGMKVGQKQVEEKNR